MWQKVKIHYTRTTTETNTIWLDDVNHIIYDSEPSLYGWGFLHVHIIDENTIEIGDFFLYENNVGKCIGFRNDYIICETGKLYKTKQCLRIIATTDSTMKTNQKKPYDMELPYYDSLPLLQNYQLEQWVDEGCKEDGMVKINKNKVFLRKMFYSVNEVVGILDKYSKDSTLKEFDQEQWLESNLK